MFRTPHLAILLIAAINHVGACERAADPAAVQAAPPSVVQSVPAQGVAEEAALPATDLPAPLAPGDAVAELAPPAAAPLSRPAPISYDGGDLVDADRAIIDAAYLTDAQRADTEKTYDWQPGIAIYREHGGSLMTLAVEFRPEPAADDEIHPLGLTLRNAVTGETIPASLPVGHVPGVEHGAYFVGLIRGTDAFPASASQWRLVQSAVEHIPDTSADWQPPYFLSPDDERRFDWEGQTFVVSNEVTGVGENLRCSSRLSDGHSAQAMVKTDALLGESAEGVANIRCDYEGVDITFIGDIDGDGKADLIVSSSIHYNNHDQHLWLSSRAKPGEIVGLIGVATAQGC